MLGKGTPDRRIGPAPFSVLVLAYSLGFLVVLRFIAFFVPESERVGIWGDASVAFVAGSALAWFEHRRRLEKRAARQKLLVVAIAALLWLVAGISALLGEGHSRTTLVAGVVGLIVCIVPDLLRAKR